MSYLLRSAKIIDSTSEFHLQNKDILIENGFISSIKDEIIAANKDVEVIKHENLLVSPGWIDPLVDFGEPGFEQRQGLENGIAEAIDKNELYLYIYPGQELSATAFGLSNGETVEL